jgi:hypothetical protein
MKVDKDGAVHFNIDDMVDALLWLSERNKKDLEL